LTEALRGKKEKGESALRSIQYFTVRVYFTILQFMRKFQSSLPVAHKKAASKPKTGTNMNIHEYQGKDILRKFG